MFISKLCIYVGAVLSLLMFLFHTRLYTLLGWKNELSKISDISRKIIYTINLALLLIFLIFGFISFIYVNELAKCEGLAFGICLGYSLFWLWRGIWQVTYFKLPKNTQVSKKGLSIYYSLVTSFTILFIVYLIPVIIAIIK